MLDRHFKSPQKLVDFYVDILLEVHLVMFNKKTRRLNNLFESFTQRLVHVSLNKYLGQVVQICTQVLTNVEWDILSHFKNLLQGIIH